MKIISPISIDLGAKHTGVCSYSYVDNGDGSTKLIPAQGLLVTIPAKTKQWEQVTRRVKRHMRRSAKRRKLAKRLIRLILTNEFQFDWQDSAHLIDSMLNRRGYTYMSDEESEINLDDIEPNFLKLFLPDFIDCDVELAKQLSDFNVEQLRQIEEAVNDYKDDVKERKKEFGELSKKLQKLIDNNQSLENLKLADETVLELVRRQSKALRK